MTRMDQHRVKFFPLEKLDHSLLYEDAITNIGALREVKSRAWDRLLRARDVYAEYLASEGDRRE